MDTKDKKNNTGYTDKEWYKLYAGLASFVVVIFLIAGLAKVGNSCSCIKLKPKTQKQSNKSSTEWYDFDLPNYHLLNSFKQKSR